LEASCAVVPVVLSDGLALLGEAFVPHYRSEQYRRPFSALREQAMIRGWHARAGML
jgi:hypothetical protein